MPGQKCVVMIFRIIHISPFFLWHLSIYIMYELVSSIRSFPANVTFQELTILNSVFWHHKAPINPFLLSINNYPIVFLLLSITLLISESKDLDALLLRSRSLFWSLPFFGLWLDFQFLQKPGLSIRQLHKIIILVFMRTWVIFHLFR